jgi:hypothetical protein
VEKAHTAHAPLRPLRAFKIGCNPKLVGSSIFPNAMLTERRARIPKRQNPKIILGSMFFM